MSEDLNRRNIYHERHFSGPHQLGDPNDESLRKVEIEVLIPKKMREIAKQEKCIEEVKNFTECCKDSNILMTFKCRAENAALKDCLTHWYQDGEFQERCRKEYLEERKEYRETGIGAKQQKRIQANMM